MNMLSLFDQLNTSEPISARTRVRPSVLDDAAASSASKFGRSGISTMEKNTFVASMRGLNLSQS